MNVVRAKFYKKMSEISEIGLNDPFLGAFGPAMKKRAFASASMQKRKFSLYNYYLLALLWKFINECL